MRLALRLRITGRVQGVGYRDWCIGEALAIRLDGWVRNRADGSVEVLVCGEADAVAAFLARAQEGPPSARVAKIERQAATSPLPEPGFRRLPTL